MATKYSVDEEEVNNSIKSAEEAVKILSNHLVQIKKKVSKLDPQTRYFVTDALIANILEGAKLPPYTLMSLLSKYSMLSQMPYLGTNIQKSNIKPSYV